MRLTRVLYFSENTMDAGGTLAGLREILSASKRNNEKSQITGALIFDDFWFIQALEGDRAQVWKTLRRIEEDERHSNIVIVDAREVGSRLFGNWWMGLATRNEQTVDAFRPYLQSGIFRPQNMTAQSILDLAVALCGAGLSRRLATAG